VVDYEQRKKEITFKALEMFSKKGYNQVNLLEIAKSCGMTRTAIYRYYKDKGEIFISAIKFFLDQTLDTMEKIASKENVTVIDRIFYIFKALYEGCRTNRYSSYLLFDLWLHSSIENNIPVQNIKNDYTKRMYKIFEDLLEKGKNKEVIKDFEIKSMATALFSLLGSYLMQSVLYKYVDSEDIFKSIKILLSGLQS
ncbi:MAG TPA: TetR/AcrR family transcriptional regulator, partial [Exilispira sp.]|nr:TetR/AcrR family transcriptional regulator [Exilispira sp.]